MSADAVITVGAFLVQPMDVSVAEAAECLVRRRWRVANEANGNLQYVAELVNPDGTTRRVCSCQLPRDIAATTRPEAPGWCLHLGAVAEATAGVDGQAT